MSNAPIDAAAQRIVDAYRSQATSNAGEAKGNAKGGFAAILKNAIESTDDMQHKADDAVTDLMAGKTDNVQDVMVAVAKADVSFRMMLQVRNRLLEAYQEVMRMQV